MRSSKFDPRRQPGRPAARRGVVLRKKVLITHDPQAEQAIGRSTKATIATAIEARRKREALS